MPDFPTDVLKARVLNALELLGFQFVSEREHLAMLRHNSDGTRTPLTLPNHSRIKGSTLRTICIQSGIPRDEFMRAFERA